MAKDNGIAADAALPQGNRRAEDAASPPEDGPLPEDADAPAAPAAAMAAPRRHARVRVGEIIDISKKKGVGFNLDGGWVQVTRLHDNGTFDVAPVLGNRKQKNVSPSRIVNLNPMVLSARRRNSEELERPSLLAPQHQPVA